MGSWVRRRATRRGFTLVELVVVISIIAVLAAILLPVINSALRRAHRTSCQANLHQLALGLRAYKTDFKAYPLGCLSTPGNQSGLKDDQGNAPGGASYDTYNATTGAQSRLGALYPNYVQTAATFVCPETDDTTILATATINGQPVATGLELTGNASFVSSTYDDYYNYFGYQTGGAINLTPPANFTKMLSNRYCPDSTMVTYCTKHEDASNVSSSMDVAVRVGGQGDVFAHGLFQFQSQPETASQ
jgi:prepilin-type N-terminal cleavage/methylation domain-containing protein